MIHTQYKAARNALREAIIKSKDSHWSRLIKEVEENPWGDAYRIAAGKPQKSQILLDANLTERIVGALFPEHAEFPREDYQSDPPTENITLGELIAAAERLKPGKSSGPDGIPPEAVKLMCGLHPAGVLRALNATLETGVFPEKWKEARLVLLRKQGKPADEPCGYRPLCMLNTWSKLLEQIINGRLRRELESRNLLSEDQYGFREGRSTTDACIRLTTLLEPNRNKRGITAVVLLDVRNAFNSASWRIILERLRAMKVSPYLRRIISSYLKDRRLHVQTTEGTKTYRITSGVPQGSVMGPTLWNVMYNGLLAEPLPDGATLVGYADDIALVCEGTDREDLLSSVELSIEAIAHWLKRHSLALAAEKTVAMISGRRRLVEPFRFMVQGHVITPAQGVNYLGVWLDRDLRYREHARQASAKALKSIASLGRILTRKGGPRTSIRRLLASVATSTLLYAAPVWAPRLRKASWDTMEAAQRQAALRVCNAYRTVSKEAALTLAGMMPLRIAAQIRCETYKGADRKEAQRAGREEWELRWQTADTGRWTNRVIPSATEWIRKSRELTFHMTQLLTGHGNMRAYLHRIGRATSPNCQACGVPEDAEHILLDCRRWTRERAEAGIGETVEAVTEMLHEGETHALAAFAEKTVGRVTP